eukprot:3895112-Alexandrium_andersonii.AAC.1
MLCIFPTAKRAVLPAGRAGTATAQVGPGARYRTLTRRSGWLWVFRLMGIPCRLGPNERTI